MTLPLSYSRATRATHAEKTEIRKSKMDSLYGAVFDFRISAFPGGQGRVRTSVDRMGRQIYSLLLLTAQPPVRNWFPCDLARTVTPFRSVFGSRWFEPSSSSLRLDAGTRPCLREAEHFSDLLKPAPENFDQRRQPSLRLCALELELAKGFEPPTL